MSQSFTGARSKREILHWREGLSRFCNVCGKEYTHRNGHCRGCQAPRPSLSCKCGNVEEDSYSMTILSMYRGVVPVCLVLLLCLLTIVVLQGIAIVHLRESHRVMTLEMRNHTEVLDLYYQCIKTVVGHRTHNRTDSKPSVHRVLVHHANFGVP